jgi:hypothetical protein
MALTINTSIVIDGLFKDLTPGLRQRADPPTGVTSPGRRGECLSGYNFGLYK